MIQGVGRSISADGSELTLDPVLSGRASRQSFVSLRALILYVFARMRTNGWNFLQSETCHLRDAAVSISEFMFWLNLFPGEEGTGFT